MWFIQWATFMKINDQMRRCHVWHFNVRRRDRAASLDLKTVEIRKFFCGLLEWGQDSGSLVTSLRFYGLKNYLFNQENNLHDEDFQFGIREVQKSRSLQHVLPALETCQTFLVSGIVDPDWPTKHYFHCFLSINLLK